jgi:SAM-dependent methyltransferase
MNEENADARVKAQYEAYPYPERNPADEKQRLIVGSPSHLLEIEHYVRKGRRLTGAEVLIAGGGTGDGAIMLAQQLKDRGDGRVTYIDISSASLAVARARADARGLDNIAFHQGSLLELARIAPGPYDYIDCCGVLHHLDDANAGLAALTARLKPDGGIGLMLYGALGRTGVYPLQRALARLAEPGSSDAARVADARRLIEQLPSGNWFKRNPNLADHLDGGDAGLYDLLLHSRDRAFTVPELTALFNASDLEPTGFIPPAQYDPALYLQDPEFRTRAAALPWLDQAALAEELSGALKTHVVYAVRKDADRNESGRCEPDDLALVPVWRETDPGRLVAAFERSPRLSVEVGGVRAGFEMPEGAAQLIDAIDGRRSLRQIHGRLRSRDRNLDRASFETRFAACYRILNGLNMLLLAAP